MNNSPARPSGTVLLTVIVVVAVLRLAQDLFVPLALAVLLTFLLAPIVARLQHWRINRLIAVIISICLALALIVVVGDVIFGQFSDLARQLPQYELHLREHIAHLRGFLRGGITDSLDAVDRLTSQIERLSPVGGLPAGVQKVEIVQPRASLFEIAKDVVGPLPAQSASDHRRAR
jgi:predicted PurR-regulated permease PerM